MQSKTFGSAAAQCLGDDHFSARIERCCEVMALLAIDENADMPANAALFIDHAETDAGILPLKIIQQCTECRALGFGAT